MILYHAITMYQLLECIVHREIFSSTDKSILILPDFIMEKFPNYLNLKKQKLFDEVYLFSYMKVPHDESTLLVNLEKVYKEDIGVPLEKFQRIYIAGVHFYFSILVAEHKIHFTAFEEAAQAIFNCDKLERNIAIKFPEHAHIAKKYQMLTYRNPYIDTILVYKKNDRINKKQECFNLYENLNKLSFHKMSKILKVFNERREISFVHPVIILTEQFYNLGYMSKDEQRILYSLVICYIKKYRGNRKIYLKPHPDDNIDYLELEGINRVLPAVTPAELIPYIIHGRSMEIVTISSTSAFGLQNSTVTDVLTKNTEFLSMLPPKSIYVKLFCDQTTYDA